MAKELRKDIRDRHLNANNILNAAAAKYLNNGIKLACEVVAGRIGCSDITVRNYVYGKGKDGYLKEAIAKEFKKLKL